MKKRVLGIVCVLSGAATVILAGVLCWAVQELIGKMDAGMGIIGGEDTPTVVFWLSYLLSGLPVFWGLLAALAVFVTTLALLIKGRKRKG